MVQLGYERIRFFGKTHQFASILHLLILGRASAGGGGGGLPNGAIFGYLRK